MQLIQLAFKILLGRYYKRIIILLIIQKAIRVKVPKIHIFQASIQSLGIKTGLIHLFILLIHLI